MFKIRSSLVLILVLITISWITSTGIWKRISANLDINRTVKDPPGDKKAPTYFLKVRQARSFAIKNGFNDSICFLIDMKIASGNKRFFVYDIKNDSIISSGLVTHGRCNQMWLEGRKYGNEPGCGCTSLGKYKIGNAYNGRFGLAYKLHGLDKTNNNAFKRFVVLHSHDCVPASEVSDEICQSDGCPTVSPDFLQELRLLINNSRNPVLLWIFE